MTGVLPHSAALQGQIDDYCSDYRSLIEDACGALARDGYFVNIFKTTLAGDSVLQKLSAKESPRLTAARIIIRRIPMLVISQQLGSARVELRRLIELTFHCIYFTDHPVEWKKLLASPTAGISREATTPITYNAHREPSFYANYAKELFDEDPSGLAKESADRLTTIYGQLSLFAHAGSTSVGKRLVYPTSVLPRAELEPFATTYREAIGNICISLSARFVARFDSLPAVHRAWFDWLIGKRRSKMLRSQQFGVHGI